MKEDNFETKEEMYAYWWLKELEDAGLIEDLTYTGQDTDGSISILEKTEKLVVDLESRKGFVQVKKRQLEGTLSYKPDFRFHVTDEGRMIVAGPYGIDTGEPMMACAPGFKSVIVEVKPVVMRGRVNMGSHDSMRRFKVIQKILLHRGTYVSLLEIPKLFKETFVPKRYFFCDKKVSQPRKIGFDTMSLDQFIEKRKKHLQAIASKGIRNESPNERAVSEALEGKIPW